MRLFLYSNTESLTSIQLFPLSLNPTLVEKFCNNFSVVEVWHRITEEATDGDQVSLCVCGQMVTR